MVKMRTSEKIMAILGMIVGGTFSIYHHDNALNFILMVLGGGIVGYLVAVYENHKNSPVYTKKQEEKGYSCSVKKQVMAKQFIGGQYPKNRFFRGRVRITDNAIIVTIGDSETHQFLFDEINDLHKRGANLRIGTNTDSVQIVNCSHTKEIVDAIEGYKIRTERYEEFKRKQATEKIEEKTEKIKNNTDEVDELEKLNALLEKGVLTDDEFETMKKRIIEK